MLEQRLFVLIHLKLLYHNLGTYHLEWYLWAMSKKIRVLVVEDHDIIGKVMVELVESTGCDVDIAKNGEKSLELYQENKYGLIFMDLGLPDIDGYEVTKKIREGEKGRGHTPIIGLSAQTDRLVMQKAIDSGMDEFIVKPLTHARCVMSISKYCDYNFLDFKEN